MNTEHLLVSKIREGTVIDHIPAGKALTVLKILGIKGDEGFRVAIVMNVDSRKLDKKDIVKIEGRELRSEEVNKIALIAPTATINIIRNYKVAVKVKVQLPERIEDIVRCSNPNCITNRSREPIKAKFKLVSKHPVLLKCIYCGRYLRSDQIVLQLSK